MTKCYDGKCEIQINHLKELMNQLYKEHPKASYDYGYKLLNDLINEINELIILMDYLDRHTVKIKNNDGRYQVWEIPPLKGITKSSTYSKRLDDDG